MPARNADGKLSEAAFQRQVLGLAGFYGWTAYHTHDSRRSQRGFPDLVLRRGHELIFAELKTDTGRLSPDQRDWLDGLGRIAEAVTAAVPVAIVAGAPADLAVEVHLWRPADFEDLHARLARGRRQVPPPFDPRQ